VPINNFRIKTCLYQTESATATVNTAATKLLFWDKGKRVGRLCLKSITSGAFESYENETWRMYAKLRSGLFDAHKIR